MPTLQIAFDTGYGTDIVWLLERVHKHNDLDRIDVRYRILRLANFP